MFIVSLSTWFLSVQDHLENNAQHPEFNFHWYLIVYENLAHQNTGIHNYIVIIIIFSKLNSSTACAPHYANRKDSTTYYKQQQLPSLKRLYTSVL